MTDSLFEMWGKREVQWELHYKEELFEEFCDYKHGASSLNAMKGKVFGGGYELYIIAFFIGLYANKTRDRDTLLQGTGRFGLPVGEWGKVERARKRYTRLMQYIFLALLAKTNVDLVALDRGELDPAKVVSALMKTMEGYANYGLRYILEEKEGPNGNALYSPGGFFNLMNKVYQENSGHDNEDDSLEEL